MRERLLESLPGYTGPNVLARGKDIEADAVYFTHELEAIIGRWIAVDYQRRPHDGLRVPEVPHLTLSPNEAYEEAVARAGFLLRAARPGSASAAAAGRGAGDRPRRRRDRRVDLRLAGA